MFAYWVPRCWTEPSSYTHTHACALTRAYTYIMSSIIKYSQSLFRLQFVHVSSFLDTRHKWSVLGECRSLRARAVCLDDAHAQRVIDNNVSAHALRLALSTKPTNHHDKFVQTNSGQSKTNQSGSQAGGPETDHPQFQQLISRQPECLRVWHQDDDRVVGPPSELRKFKAPLERRGAVSGGGMLPWMLAHSGVTPPRRRARWSASREK
jgi:hypothetical protein